MLGTDFPYESGEEFQLAIDYINEAGLSAGAVQKILDENATSLFASLNTGAAVV